MHHWLHRIEHGGSSPWPMSRSRPYGYHRHPTTQRQSRSTLLTLAGSRRVRNPNNQPAGSTSRRDGTATASIDFRVPDLLGFVRL